MRLEMCFYKFRIFFENVFQLKIFAYNKINKGGCRSGQNCPGIFPMRTVLSQEREVIFLFI